MQSNEMVNLIYDWNMKTKYLGRSHDVVYIL
jgi:hypothetical protein